MPHFSIKDHIFMANALRIAKKGQYTAHPNPMVGCVLAKDGKIIGQGWHKKTGAAHAEINALQDAGENANGSTAYVTLEPCSQYGKTPPCFEALIKAGVKKVITATKDPSQKFSDKALESLIAAGVAVEYGLMKSAAEELNRGFLMRVTKQRPFIQLKLAVSIDGAISMKNGESQWITSSAARKDVQKLRARAGAIMTGIGTILEDDPLLNIRENNIETGGIQPIRVILDSHLRTPVTASILKLSGKNLVCCTNNKKSKNLMRLNAEVKLFKSINGLVDCREVFEELASRGINNLLIEAGPTLSGYLLERKLVDELIIYQAPHIMGSETIKLASTPSWTSLVDREELVISDTRRVGSDTRIITSFNKAN
ncbi:MAG: riboflavin biosynthesis protein RibD [Gammaproteobacteria bacterium]|nr:riboflavin biosynthesis protein RibD [Gammaproteobacteria bacterium]|tara:strand:+ start:1857 stop:2963 length:1107 start_codon:yes stop_codon:yes gene_type:complete